MPAVLLSPIGNGAQFFGVNGLPLNGGFLKTYSAGTSTPLETYTTNAGNIANATSIPLGADGRPPNEIWLRADSAYKLVLTDNLGVPVAAATYDNISGISDIASLTSYAAGHGADLIGCSRDQNVLAGTLAGKLYQEASVLDFPFKIGATDEQAIAAAMTWAKNYGAPVKITIPGNHNYAISAPINCDLPEHSCISAYGALFTCSHDGVTFDLNPPATALIPNATASQTKRGITWMGGQFLNTNASKTASVAIQAYMMRMLRVKDVKVNDNGTSGFYAAFKFAGDDTYHFTDCYTYGCKRHYWIPAANVVFPTNQNGLDLLDFEARGCHVASDGTDEYAYLFENRVIGAHWNGGSVNGTFTQTQIKCMDNNLNAGDDYQFNGLHMEGAGLAGSVIWFNAAGGAGFSNISFDGGMLINNTAARATDVKLERCTGVKFGAGRVNGPSPNVAAYGISVDANCRKVRVDTSTWQFVNFMTAFTITGAANNGSGLIRIQSANLDRLATGDRVYISGVTGTTEANSMWVVTAVDSTHVDLQGSTFTNAWVSGGTMRLMNAITVSSTADRKNIALLPEMVHPNVPQVLTGYNAAAKSTGTETVNMAKAVNFFVVGVTNEVFQTYLWPKGYHIAVVYSDSGSLAAGAGTALATLAVVGASIPSVRVSTRGLANSLALCNSGYVPANDDGNIDLIIAATGASASSITLHCSAFAQ